MKTQTFHLELITPCFCGGANPQEQAEIRASSIRGQLRWWFRVLGGFKSLAPMTVREQEAMIFGSTAGDRGTAGKLVVRVSDEPRPSVLKKDDQEFNATVGTDRGYLLFPLRSKRDRNTRQITEYKGRALYDPTDRRSNQSKPLTFEVHLLWRDNSTIAGDLDALVTVFGNLGALGFRSRRAMGALAFAKQSPSLREALMGFNNGEVLKNNIYYINQRPGSDDIISHWNAEDCLVSLSKWLQDWRSHGRTVDHRNAPRPKPPHNQGFNKAEIDHDRGIEVGSQRGHSNDTTYRSALGLPIIQFFSSGHRTVYWNEKWDYTKAAQHRDYKGEGRFASPVLLRPHRDASGKWHALVIFVDAQKWPDNKKVYLNGQPREVSLDLYEEMKRDKALKPFLP
jgi:CRISPR type III-B/RAMP module RAMP protein Cmr1